MKRLTQIGIKTGTDKATLHSFTEVYDHIFSKYTNPRIFEIGVLNKWSINMYLEYFDNPYIVGMDIHNNMDIVKDDFKFVQGDQSNVADLERCIQGEDKFDIILDDGGHTMKQQQVSFGFLIDHVKSGGYYILEDLHTSMLDSYINSDCEFTSFDMVNRIMQKEEYFSNYIPIEKQNNIIEKIDSVQIWIKDNKSLHNSVTCIFKTK
jgi:hypothetical protein